MSECGEGTRHVLLEFSSVGNYLPYLVALQVFLKLRFLSILIIIIIIIIIIINYLYLIIKRKILLVQKLKYIIIN
jgi:hypothetical protein